MTRYTPCIPTIKLISLFDASTNIKGWWCLKFHRRHLQYCGGGFYYCDKCKSIHSFRDVETDVDAKGNKCFRRPTNGIA